MLGTGDMAIYLPDTEDGLLHNTLKGLVPTSGTGAQQPIAGTGPTALVAVTRPVAPILSEIVMAPIPCLFHTTLVAGTRGFGTTVVIAFGLFRD
ncbi:unnamed protein product [Caretta caretta]